MAIFKTDVPKTARTALEAEAALQAIIDQNENNFRAASAPESAVPLLRAVFAGLEQASEDAVGLSASRAVSDGGVEWIVRFEVDHALTVICSQEGYTDVAPENVAAMIAGCWDVEWDD